MKPCTVAVAQMRVTPSAEANTTRIIRFIKAAAARRADIVLFPEGSVYDESKRNFSGFSRYLKQIQSACKINRIWCIFASYNKQRRKILNTAFLINRSGKVVYRYNKKHLYFPELRRVTPGRANRAVGTEFGKIGIIICFDDEWPDDIRALAREGAWIIFCPSSESDWPSDDVVRVLPLVRAYEAQSYFILCDSVEPATAKVSTIASPYRIVKQLVGREGMITAKLDPNKIKRIRRQPFIRGLRQ
jgi:predicted amidohydrolase